eukprot:TRINITY_DN196_c0_g1_i1.p1 TRINITY_DN196_c0_g1~~TRINITY_DN196_c0_g1_i1.p1  ORF type:complete len:219 (+),score=79.02 TRINITY_DN196_c0_g1_i1:68-724(+)
MPGKKAAAKKSAPKKAAEKKPEQKSTGGADAKAVYVKKLNFPGMNVETVTAAFKQCGEVKAVNLRRGKYCILYFKDAAGASKAKDLNGKQFKGQLITVEAAKKKQAADRSETAKTVFVGNLSRNKKSEDRLRLGKVFGDCGTVKKVKTYKTGHAFVYYADHAAAAKAVAKYDNTILPEKEFPHKRTVTVKFSVRTKEIDAKKEAARKARIAAKKAKKN